MVVVVVGAAVFFTSGMSALLQDRVIVVGDACGLEASGLSKPSRPALSRPGGLPSTGHSALLGGLPQLPIGRPRRGLAMSAEDRPTDARYVTFSSRWAAWHAPTPRAPTSLGFAIGRWGHSESVKDPLVFSGLGWFLGLGVGCVGCGSPDRRASYTGSGNHQIRTLLDGLTV